MQVKFHQIFWARSEPKRSTFRVNNKTNRAILIFSPYWQIRLWFQSLKVAAGNKNAAFWVTKASFANTTGNFNTSLG
jgi:hypothetical protein